MTPPITLLYLKMHHPKANRDFENESRKNGRPHITSNKGPALSRATFSLVNSWPSRKKKPLLAGNIFNEMKIVILREGRRNYPFYTFLPVFSLRERICIQARLFTVPLFFVRSSILKTLRLVTDGHLVHLDFMCTEKGVGRFTLRAGSAPSKRP